MSVCGNIFRSQNKFSPFPLSPSLSPSLSVGTLYGNASRKMVKHKAGCNIPIINILSVGTLSDRKRSRETVSHNTPNFMSVCGNASSEGDLKYRERWHSGRTLASSSFGQGFEPRHQDRESSNKMFLRDINAHKEQGAKHTTRVSRVTTSIFEGYYI
jgi:hypothetical protein